MTAGPQQRLRYAKRVQPGGPLCLVAVGIHGRASELRGPMGKILEPCPQLGLRHIKTCLINWGSQVEARFLGKCSGKYKSHHNRCHRLNAGAIASDC